MLLFKLGLFIHNQKEGVIMHPVQAKRLDQNMSVPQLAARTGLSDLTIYNIESLCYQSKIHETVAAKLAEYFGCKISELFRDNEITHQGRPALTGASFLRKNVRVNPVCQECWIELPSSGICDCAAWWNNPPPRSLFWDWSGAIIL